MLNQFFCLIIFLTSLSAHSSSGVFDIIHETEEEQFTNKAVILAINKVTTKHKIIEIAINDKAYFGNISITAHKCNKVNNSYAQDNQIFIDVTEYSLNNDPKLLFKGWMMSSSPSLSTIEHPIYQILAIKCVNDEV